MLTEKQKSIIRHALAYRWWYIGEIALKCQADRDITERYLDELAADGIAEQKFGQYRITDRESKLSFPHELSCPECREFGFCNQCALYDLPSALCTNGRCAGCCRKVCKHKAVA